MKVKVTYIIRNDGEKTNGRSAWITRSRNGLAIGNIYTTKNKAADLTERELQEVSNKAHETGRFYISHRSASGSKQ